MTFAEVVHVFDEVRPVTGYEDQPGHIVCCGRSVVMVNGQRVYCTVCGREAVNLYGNQWVVGKWGTKGIKVGGW